MKQKLLVRVPAAFTSLLYILMFLLYSSCQDECERAMTYTLYEPVYLTFDELRASVAKQAPEPVREAGKIYIIGNYLLVNEPGKGIHVFNNADPATPENLAFINIPGNIDMAVKGNILYADSYVDLVALDISDPENIQVVSRVTDVFPVWNSNLAAGQQIDPGKGIITDWKQSRTTQISDCNTATFQPYMWYGTSLAVLNDSKANTSAPISGGSKPGIGGSMAKYTIYENYLYTIDHANMQLFDISTPAQPFITNQINIGWNIETIFPYKDKLFIGSQTGMHIYDNANPASPVHISTFAHVRSCDPVVVDDNYAYVTLRNGNTCGGFTNQLDVVDISSLATPKLVKSYPMGNPHGLGLDNKTLFICDGTFGLKVYDASDPLAIDKAQLSTKPGHAFDVIPYDNIAIVTGTNGISQYDYSDPKNLKLLSTIPVAAE
jgi:hypothetical protein